MTDGEILVAIPVEHNSNVYSESGTTSIADLNIWDSAYGTLKNGADKGNFTFTVPEGEKWLVKVDFNASVRSVTNLVFFGNIGVWVSKDSGPSGAVCFDNGINKYGGSRQEDAHQYATGIIQLASGTYTLFPVVNNSSRSDIMIRSGGLFTVTLVNRSKA